jgi:hypothetical protein
MRVLHRHLRPEFHVLAHGFAEVRIGGHGRGVEGGQVQLDEPLTLLFGDMETSVHIDEMLEAQLPAETVRTSEGLGRECSEVVDVLRLATAEKGTEDRIGQDTSVEAVLQSVQALVATRVLVEGRHHPRLPSTLGASDRPADRGWLGVWVCPSGSTPWQIALVDAEKRPRAPDALTTLTENGARDGRPKEPGTVTPSRDHLPATHRRVVSWSNVTNPQPVDEPDRCPS